MRKKVCGEKENSKFIRDLRIQFATWKPSYPPLCKQCVVKIPFTKDVTSLYERDDLWEVPFEGCKMCGSVSIDRFDGFIPDDAPLNKPQRLLISGMYKLTVFFMLLYFLKLAFQKLFQEIAKGLRVSVEVTKKIAKKGLVVGLAELGDCSWGKFVYSTEQKFQDLIMEYAGRFCAYVSLAYWVITGKNDLLDSLIPPKDFVEYDDWHLLNEDLRRNANHTDSAEKVESD